MMALLAAEKVPLDWAGYCVLTLDKQLVWEEKGDKLTIEMFYLMNSNNEKGKKNLCLAYSQGNMTAYPPNIKAMAQYLLTQYLNNKPANQRNGKKGIHIREMIQNPKTKTVTRVTLQVHTLEILLQLNNSLLLAMGLVSALTLWRQMYSRPVHCLLWRRF